MSGGNFHLLFGGGLNFYKKRLALLVFFVKKLILRKHLNFFCIYIIMMTTKIAFRFKRMLL